MKRIALSLLALLAASPLANAKDLDEARRVDKIERIFMDTPREFTFLVRTGPQTLEPKVLTTSCWNTQLIEDVSPADPMWARVFRTDGIICGERMEVHVHSIRDIGAGVDKTKRSVFGPATAPVHLIE
jgi:hypothetical protein